MINIRHDEFQRIKKAFSCLMSIVCVCLICSCQKNPNEQSEKDFNSQTNADVIVQKIQYQQTFEDEKDITNLLVAEKSQMLPNKDFDDSIYDDPVILEFCLKDNLERTFCLYHNIYKLKDFDTDDSEIFKDWSTETRISRWHKQEKNGLSVVWNYRNGAILIMETESSRYSTKRGIRVGDSLEEIISAYEKDCDIYEYDSLNKKYNIVKQDEKDRFVLHKSENSISIDAANMIEEEMMEISFDLKDNSITKISILCGD